MQALAMEPAGLVRIDYPDILVMHDERLDLVNLITRRRDSLPERYELGLSLIRLELRHPRHAQRLARANGNACS